MIPIAEATRLILEGARRLPTELVSLADTLGRTLAEDQSADRPLPPVDVSAMDGFAVNTADLAGGQTTLMVVGVTHAGSGGASISRGQARRIMTGAAIPEGADAVVPVEEAQVTLQGGERVEVPGDTGPGQHVRWAGEDLRQGEVVLPAGTTISSAQMGLLASLGRAFVPVVRRPRVGILSTGDELFRPGEPVSETGIYASNTFTIMGLVEESGGIPEDRGLVKDRMDDLRRALADMMDCDLVLTTGGVSMGELDLVREALASEGAEEVFWRAAIRPGKPIAFSRRGHTRIFSLPGNPVSAAVTFLQFVRPLIRTLLGATDPFLPLMPVIAGEAFRKPPGRAGFLRVSLSTGPDGRLRAWNARSQSSGVLSGLARAHGLLFLPAESSGLEPGDEAQAQILSLDFARLMPS